MWCFVAFDVNEYGAVSVIDYIHCSDSLYESNAREVMMSAFYVPEIMDGRPSSRFDATTVLVYKIADERGRLYPFK